MRYSPLPLAVRTVMLFVIDATAHSNADSHLFLRPIGIPGGTGSILVSRLSTAWHLAISAIPHNTPPVSTGAGVYIDRSSHSHHEPSPRTVMLVLLLVAIPVALVYFLVLHVSAWLAASFTFSMLALIFLCIAVRLPRTYHTLFSDVFFADHCVTSRGLFDHQLLFETRVRPGHVCNANPFGGRGFDGRVVTCFVFRASIGDWLACPHQPLIMRLGRGLAAF